MNASVVKMYSVDGQGNDVEIGQITWDGSEVTAHPTDLPVLQHVMKSPVVAPDGAGKTRMLAAKDGALFLAGLRFQYRSAYLRASAPEATA